MRFFILILLTTFTFAKVQLNSSMVISGGVSLGAYEAGYNWAMINLMKQLSKNSSKVSVNLKSIAGASAGSINSLISAVYWCQDNDNVYNSASKNLFYDTWVDIDYEDLIIKKQHPTNQSTLFKRDSLEIKANNIIKHMQKNIYKKGCNLPLGVAVTKVNPITEVYNGITIKNQSFGILLDVYEKNGHLNIKNSNVKTDLYTLKIPKIDKNIDYIKKVLFASSAFPGAFKQVELEYSYKSKVSKDFFIDGGTYNNVPLDLAIALSKNSKLFFFIDPDNIRDRACTQSSKSLINHKTVNEKIKDNSGFIGSNLLPLLESSEIMRAMKLYETIRNNFILNNKDGKKLILSSRHHPITGYFLWHFGAFLDRNFREYDYYVGVYDAIVKISQESIKHGYFKDKKLVDLMYEFKSMLNLNNDANRVFKMLLDIECYAKLPKITDKYSAIFNAFNLKSYQNRRYSFDEFKKFIAKLNNNYLDINENSFLKYAKEYKEDWYKKLGRDFINRVTYIENQRAQEDANYTKVARAMDISAWLSMGVLSKKEGFIIQPVLIPDEDENINYYKLLPTEFAIDSVNGGFSLGYSAIYYHDFALFDGIEFKLNYINSKHVNDHLRLDVDPFWHVDDIITAGAGVSVFKNLQKDEKWPDSVGYGANIFIDYNEILRFTYAKRFGKYRQDYFYFGIKNIPSLFYWLNK